MEIRDTSSFKQTMNEALSLDPSETVALTVDMQREYLDASVGQAVVEQEAADRVLSSSKMFLDRCRAMGIPVIHAYVTRRQEELDAGIHTGGLAYNIVGRDLNASQAPHLPTRTRGDRVVGSPESEVPAMLVEPSDVHVTTKKSLDSFSGTDLEFLLLRTYKAKNVLLSGINTDTCVYSTTFTAANLGYTPVVLSDCVASMRGEDSHEMALELMARSIAWVMPSDQVLKILEG
ncbi:MAG: cysteine hydrolase [Acidimicrobiia bacterium]|nr:cysteine hydrolase [Acidimicrobiia bacterium]